jgi:hypothetical protein
MAPFAGKLQPVVFVGPTCPPDDIFAILPDAFIVPPAARGDLYRFRMLNFSVFLILDGVFGNALAVSPREVIDVIEDGAAIVGASSMGALRAADCRPAGALGHGLIYRLYRRRVLGSEDEVAVTFMAERPWPAMTQPLVNMRIAIRRARRAGLFTRGEACALEQAALELPFQSRIWDTVAARAGIALSPERRQFLSACDVKREDARSCCRLLAQILASGGIDAGPRQFPSALVGRMLQQRERGVDPLDGADFSRMRRAFRAWQCVSGPEGPEISALADPASANPQADASIMRFVAFRRAKALAAETGMRPGPGEIAEAGAEIAREHGLSSFDELLNSHRNDKGLLRRFKTYRRDRAAILVLLRKLLHAPVPTPPWMRHGRPDSGGSLGPSRLVDAKESMK